MVEVMLKCVLCGRKNLGLPMKKNLSNLKPGEKGRVLSVESGELSAKLVEMGLYEGKQVEVLYCAPLGDPIAIDIDGYILSLRLDEAKFVALETSAA
jgi:Fe2+ transport system protein FeoA